jgi:hypothetical protein
MKKTISIVVILTFVTSMVISPRPSNAQGVMGLPSPGAMVDLSPSYVPVMITGLTVHPENPLLMDFIVNTGNTGMGAGQVRSESERLIKYFLACLTIPENDQWVNLSPYEKQRIVPEDLGQTVLGRDMLAQDYLLKQLTASLIYPEKNLGKSFWDRVYAKANEMYGTTQIPVNTFNKVWILPDTAKVYEHKDTVFVVKSHLKIMLDEDYLSLLKHLNSPSLVQEENKGNSKDINTLGSQIVRQIILPAIEKEVNTGVNFARLRQIYNSMILAVWFKKNLREALLNQVYTDKAKLNGVDVDDPTIKERIYRQYVQAYRKGVFNYIKEEADPNTQEIIPRKYFSGGLTPVDAAMLQPVSEQEATATLGALPGVTFKVSGLTLIQGPQPNLPEPPLKAAEGLGLSELEENLRTIISEESSYATRRISVGYYKSMPGFSFNYNGQDLPVAVWPNESRGVWGIAVDELKDLLRKSLANGDQQAVEAKIDSMTFNFEPVKRDNMIVFNITDAAMAGGKRNALISKSYNAGVGRVTLEFRFDGTYTHVRTINQLPAEIIRFSARYKDKGDFTDLQPVEVVSNYYKQKEKFVDEAMASGGLGIGRRMQLEPGKKLAFVTTSGRVEVTANDNGSGARIDFRKEGQPSRADVNAERPRASIYNDLLTVYLEGDRVYVQNNSDQAVDYATEDKAMTAPQTKIERLSPQQIMDRFHLAFPDALYFSVLIAKYLSDRINPVLGQNGIASALLNAEARQKTFGMVDGKSVMDDITNSETAKQVHMRVLELKGGIGTSFNRTATLLRLTGRKTLADKGTDSYFENVPVQGYDASGQPKEFKENISVAELKLLYYIRLAKQGEFSELEVRELVNAESQEAVNKFWDTVYLGDRVDDRIAANDKRTYRQVFSPEKGIKGLHFNPDFIVQGVLPVVDAQSGEYLNHEALRSPGGHGAFVALTMDDNAGNKKDLSAPRITVFTNGDGVNNMLPPAVAGWMVKNKAPIVMVTTTKQLLDLKGGLITLLSNTDLPAAIREKLNRFETLSMEDITELQKSLYPYLLELAQAKTAGQQDVFQKMGITLGEKSAQFFNTNVHAQYHNVLDPFLADLRNILGDEKFYEIIGPDLIVNPKNKKADGKPVSVIQLEGASGSALLAMNRFILTATDPRIKALKEKYGIERLVYFVNFDEQLRSEVFTPEKFTWDHYLYAFTDLFSVEPDNGRLKFTPNPGRNTLPGFDLSAPYEDLEYDINAFGRNLSVKGLDYLAIRGEVGIPNAILRGGVFIRNNSGQFVDLTTKTKELPFENGRLVLDNVLVTIDQGGNVTTSPVPNLLDAVEKFESDKAMQSPSIDDGNDVLTANAAMTAPVNTSQQVKRFIFDAATGGIKPSSTISFTLNPAAAKESGTQSIIGAQIVGVSPVDGSIRIKRPLPKNLPIRKLIQIKNDGYESFKASDFASVPVVDAAMQGGMSESNSLSLSNFIYLASKEGIRKGQLIDIQKNGVQVAQGAQFDHVDAETNEVVYTVSGFFNSLYPNPSDKILIAVHPDAAMATGNKATKGGIDINSRYLNMQSEGEKVNITFDPAAIAQFKRGDFSGVNIKILDVVPVNLLPLLGLKI